MIKLVAEQWCSTSPLSLSRNTPLLSLKASRFDPRADGGGNLPELF
jgi:hypothetical protein